MDELNAIIDDLVVANRILAHEEVVDAYGHISVRHPLRSDRFLIACSRSPELIAREDIVEVDLACKPINGNGRAMYTELPIHGAIYQVRPDVRAIVHNHAYEVIPFTTSNVRLQPILHSAAHIGSNIPIWDIRDRFGNTDMLVRTLDQGLDLARALSSNTVVLMRGHGCVVVGASLETTVQTAVYLKVNAKIQTEALRFGENVYLNEEEIEKVRAHQPASGLARLWQYWAKRAGF